MKDGILMLMVNEDGKLVEYDDAYDITIHCESEEEQKEVMKILNGRQNDWTSASRGDLAAIIREWLSDKADVRILAEKILPGEDDSAVVVEFTRDGIKEVF